jgi:hypothetical protein
MDIIYCTGFWRFRLTNQNFFMRFATGLVCWKCGASLAELPLPLSRLAECPKCRAYQHACRSCEFYDPRLTSQCREERAEEVRAKEGANFCDWFRPRPNAYRPRADGKTQAAKTKLDDLFGGAQAADGQADVAQDKLSDLFTADKKPRK